MLIEEMKKDAEKYGIEYYKKGRILVWHDEFDKPKIDMDKWVFHSTMSYADREYDNSEKHARIEDNQLLLQAHYTGKEDKKYSLSQGLTTKYTMNWKYGYLEMRAKVPFRVGAFPSFWTQSCTVFQKCPWMCETDIFESFQSLNTIYATTHKIFMKPKYIVSSSSCFLKGYKRSYKFENYENLNDEYHVYGYEWCPEYMAFSVDGVEYAKYPIDPIKGNYGYEIIDGVMGFHDFQFIILNNELYTEANNWNPYPDGRVLTPDATPVEYRVDWMRLYQNPEKEEIKLKSEIEEVLAAKQAEEEQK